MFFETDIEIKLIMYKLFVDIFLLFFTIFLIDIPFENPIGRSWGGTSNKNQVINLDNGQDISNINPVVSKKSRFKCSNQSEHHNLDNGQDIRIHPISIWL